ncbi:hypothetical protein EIP91_011913 [Steccherinum ochraceum]|uniref:N-acetyltransferase domain-containing protein n=1 Tax=Steccherinum ochraceum TaxID=92696 RepID=A0A4R0RHN0_9APHY|nr:hypothetical protein EIP91_011913 [Steccherinum ochraceum]
MSTFTNAYKPPIELEVLPEAELHGPTPYDINFVLPIHLESLQTERVFLTPLIPSIHGKAYWDAISSNLDLFNYYPFVKDTYEGMMMFIETFIRRNPKHVLFAIIDKTRPDPVHPEFGGGSLAGVVGLFESSGRASEIGHVLTFPAFQRTHVTSNASGILARYCMELATASPPGLGLRRIEWRCHAENARSARLAERLGMRKEGVLRWNSVAAVKSLGRKPREGDPSADEYGRDTLVLSICWDEWEAGVREKVQAVISRPS